MGYLHSGFAVKLTEDGKIVLRVRLPLYPVTRLVQVFSVFSLCVSHHGPKIHCPRSNSVHFQKTKTFQTSKSNLKKIALIWSFSTTSKLIIACMKTNNY